MKFRDWLESRGASQSWAAAQLGVTQQYISMLCDDDRKDRPGLVLAMKIHQLTDFQVPITEWIEKGKRDDSE